MRRPFACVGFSMLVSLVFAIEFGHTAALCCAVVCFVLSAVFFSLKFIGRKKTLTAAVCALAACFSFTAYSLMIAFYVNPLIEKYDGENVEFTATVTTKPYTENGNTYFNVKTSEINGEPEKINLQIITNYTLPMDCYDTVIVNAQLYSDYESGYGYASYYGARNIFLKAYINTYFESSYEVIKNDSKPFYSVFSSLREIISRTLQKYLSYDEASVCTAIITGEKYLLPDNINNGFRNLGVSHILVVSGLHLSIIAGLLHIVTARTIKNRYLSAVLQIIGIAVYAALSGCGFSVIRAGIMASVLVLARMLSSRADTLNSLGLAAIILCLDPLNAGDIGLLWSFASVLSLILLSVPIRYFIMHKLGIAEGSSLEKIASTAATAAAAFIGSLPFLIFVSGSLSPYTIAVNILTVPFTGIIIVCGGLSVLLFSLHLSVLAYPLIYICGLTTKYILFVIDIFSELPISSINTSKSYVYVWFAACVILFALIYLLDKKRRYTGIGVCAVTAVLVVLYSIDTILNSEKIIFSVLDVGDGLTVTVKTSDSLLLLNSYGEKYQYNAIKSELSEYDCIACMIDIAPSTAKYNYCERIVREFDVQSILLYDISRFDLDYGYTRYTGVSTTMISNDYTLRVCDGAEIKLITVDDITWEYLNIYDCEILICPQGSDISDLPDEYKSPDIAVISGIPEGFDLINTDYVVVSNYGNDCIEAKASVEESGNTAAVTNGLGRIDFTFDSDGSIELEREYTGGVVRYGSDN